MRSQMKLVRMVFVMTLDWTGYPLDAVPVSCGYFRFSNCNAEFYVAHLRSHGGAAEAFPYNSLLGLGIINFN